MASVDVATGIFSRILITSIEFQTMCQQRLMYGARMLSAKANITSVVPPIADTIGLMACGVL